MQCRGVVPPAFLDSKQKISFSVNHHHPFEYTAVANAFLNNTNNWNTPRCSGRGHLAFKEPQLAFVESMLPANIYSRIHSSFPALRYKRPYAPTASTGGTSTGTSTTTTAAPSTPSPTANSSFEVALQSYPHNDFRATCSPPRNCELFQGRSLRFNNTVAASPLYCQTGQNDKHSHRPPKQSRESVRPPVGSPTRQEQQRSDGEKRSDASCGVVGLDNNLKSDPELLHRKWLMGELPSLRNNCSSADGTRESPSALSNVEYKLRALKNIQRWRAKYKQQEDSVIRKSRDVAGESAPDASKIRLFNQASAPHSYSKSFCSEGEAATHARHKAVSPIPEPQQLPTTTATATAAPPPAPSSFPKQHRVIHSPVYVAPPVVPSENQYPPRRGKCRVSSDPLPVGKNKDIDDHLRYKDLAATDAKVCSAVAFPVGGMKEEIRRNEVPLPSAGVTKKGSPILAALQKRDRSAMPYTVLHNLPQRRYFTTPVRHQEFVSELSPVDWSNQPVSYVQHRLQRCIVAPNYPISPEIWHPVKEPNIKQIRVSDRPQKVGPAAVPYVSMANTREVLRTHRRVTGGISELPTELQVNISDVKFQKRIGRGASADVWLGTWRSCDVAVKIFNEKMTVKMFQFGSEDFLRELEIMMKLRHPHLVLLMGVSLWQRPMSIVTEYCAGGDLYSLLHGASRKSKSSNDLTDEMVPKPPLTWVHKMNIAHGIVKGCAFLHTSTPQIIHRDLKSPNILLAQPLVSESSPVHVKITDFGLSRLTSTGVVKTRCAAGTGYWMAPELFNPQNSFDEKVDIYAFGILLYELITRTLPYVEQPEMSLFVFGRLIVSGLRPELRKMPADCPQRLRELMLRCWSHTPSSRPSFEEILEELTEINVSLPEPSSSCE